MKELPGRALLLLLLWTPLSNAAAQQTSSPSEATSPANANNEASCQALGSTDNGTGLLPRLCQFALGYRRQLPDFIAQQTITIHNGRSKTIVTEQVVFRQGRESYSHLLVDGKPVPATEPLPRKIQFLSAGEFGSLLVNLFVVPGGTEFKFRKTATLQNVPVDVYQFHVPREKNSFWTLVDLTGQSIQPELRGELWLDRATGHPLRQQLEAVHLPSGWSTTLVKTLTEYEITKVGDLGSYLLPVRSETTVCAVQCMTHELVFRDYQKFTISTRIVDAAPSP